MKPIIMTPQVAIIALGTSQVQKKPVSCSFFDSIL
jgi:hypothetical protein